MRNSGLIACFLFSATILFTGCGKDDDPAKQNNCADKNISFNASMDAEGSIMVLAADGGTSPYTYSVAGSGYQTGEVFSNNYPEGDYSITVKDADGCSQSNTFFLSPTLGCGGNTITDIDGNIYQVIQIGNQCWTQENLKTTRYRNGDTIPTGLNEDQWFTTTQGAYGIYANQLYGKLYNGYAVTDARGLCPDGWRVPTEGDFETLIDNLGGELEAGGKLKATNQWESPNTGATNSSNFTALPGGELMNNNEFNMQGKMGVFMSSSSGTSTNTIRSLFMYHNDAGVEIKSTEKSQAFSCRCIKE